MDVAQPNLLGPKWSWSWLVPNKSPMGRGSLSVEQMTSTIVEGVSQTILSS